MTGYEDQVIELLGHIRNEMVVASLPEDYRKYQRELFAIRETKKIWENMADSTDRDLQVLIDAYVKEHPEYQGYDYDSIIQLKSEFIKLDKQAQNFVQKSTQIEQRIEKLCEHYKCVNVYERR